MLTLKILASLLQLHGPDATVQSDHQGIDALLNNLRDQNAGAASDEVAPTQVVFRRGGFVRGPAAGAFRRGAVAPGAGAFRRGFARGY
jgi:hypothetical protein